MSALGFPPSHRNVDEVQPEVCDLCGLYVGGMHLAQSDAEGLRGFFVCDVTEGCKRFRASLSWRDRRRLNARDYSRIGQSRIYPSGAKRWWVNLRRP